MIYLYVKKHLDTGLKYLGKTKNKDPHRYKGSGVYWKQHLKKYGSNFSTEILFSSEDTNEIQKMGLYYSELWNIVENNEWANLIPETGNGIEYQKTKYRKRTQDEILRWKQTMIENGKLGNNNTDKMVQTRRLKDNFKSNRDPEIIRKQNESKIKNGTSMKGKKLPPEQITKRIGFCWYNNGVKCKKIYPGDIIPENYVKGKLHKFKS